MKNASWRWLDADSLLLRTAGLVALLSIPFKYLPRRVEGLVPLHLARTSHLVSFCIGLGLMYLAGQVALRKKNSWYLATAALALLIVAELLHFRNFAQLAVYVLALGLLVWHRKQYVVISDATSLRQGLLTAASMMIVVIVFVLIVFEMLDQRAFGRDFNTFQTLSITWQQLIGGQPPADVRLLRYDRMLIGLLRISIVAMAVIVLASLFRPLRLRGGTTHAHQTYAQGLLRRYSNSPEDFFKLWPADKHYYFYGDSMLAYAAANGVAMVLDGATGRPEDILQIRPHFLEYARRNGWQVAVIHADESEAHAWQEYGLKQLFIGSEAMVAAPDFVTKTSRSKHFRYVRNRAAKDGLQFEWWQPPHSKEQLSQLQAVSQAWLGQSGRREYGFMMGYFDKDYMAACQIAVLRNSHNNQLVAYTNLIPVFTASQASIDHIRSVPEVSSVAMHYLLLQTISHTAEQGVINFNLGLAPLSRLNKKTDKNLEERLLAAVKRLGSRYYSFAGLEQFKGKFEPLWSSRYILYQRNNLLPVAAALNSVTTYRSAQSDGRKTWLVAAAGLAGLAFASFPLAWLLNPHYANSALASHLGEPGQPYYWVFNGLDIVSGGLAITVLLVVWRLTRPLQRLRTWLLSLTIASCLGTVAAAMATLPNGYVDVDSVRGIHITPQLVGHAASSFVSSAAFVLAAIVWAVAWRKAPVAAAWWRWTIAALIAACSTVGYIIGDRWPAASPVIQHSFILLYTIWLPLLVFDLLYRWPPKSKIKYASPAKLKH